MRWKLPGLRRERERYPYLAGGRPDLLPGIDEMARLAEDAVIVSATDPFHHDIGYGTPADEALSPDENGRTTEHRQAALALTL